MLQTGDSYAFTPAASIRAVEETLEGSPHGALSPAAAFGADFAFTIQDTTWIEVPKMSPNRSYRVENPMDSAVQTRQTHRRMLALVPPLKAALYIGAEGLDPLSWLIRPYRGSPVPPTPTSLPRRVPHHCSSLG